MLHELTLIAASAQVEPLCEAFEAAGACSLTLEDADADSAAEQALYGEPGTPGEADGEPVPTAWARSRLRVLLPAGLDPQQVLEKVADAVDFPLPAVDAIQPVADADWVRLTQSQFPPTQVGRRLWVVPSWHQPPDPDAVIIRLDPGVAFGTGTHPTTRLCLAWLEAFTNRFAQPPRVLDYGCGSGILAIAARKLGGGDVFGTDLDPQALAAARANWIANGLPPAEAHYTPPQGLPDTSALGLPGDGRFDIVLANILANPLRVLAPALLARVADGGALVLAGLLAHQADDLIAVYRACDPDVHLAVWQVEDGWACLAGWRATRPPA